MIYLCIYDPVQPGQVDVEMLNSFDGVQSVGNEEQWFFDQDARKELVGGSTVITSSGIIGSLDTSC